jgi:hypothetical protein
MTGHDVAIRVLTGEIMPEQGEIAVQGMDQNAFFSADHVYRMLNEINAQSERKLVIVRSQSWLKRLFAFLGFAQ